MQVLASYAGEEADEWELDGMAAITRNTYGEGEAYFLGCDLGVSDLTRFVGGWLAAQPQDGRQPEANLRSLASGVTSDVLHTVRQSDDAIFDFYLTRGRSDVELRDIAGEPIVLFRAERGSDGGAYTVHRNGVFVTKRPNPSVWSVATKQEGGAADGFVRRSAASPLEAADSDHQQRTRR